MGTILRGSEDGALRASDEDVADGFGDSLVYSWTGTGASAAASMLSFQPSSTNIDSVALASVLDHEAADQYSLVLRATDTDSNHDDAFVRLIVEDKNEPSVIERIEKPDGTTLGTGEKLQVREMATSGTIVGRVVASDEDSGAWGRMQFSLDPNSPSTSFFEIDGTGVIRLRAGARLDWEN